MTLIASDELRHPFDDDPVWRESLYWNFGVPELNLGGWIYAWVTPNKAERSGMLVSFYQGMLKDPTLPARAAAEPNHFLRQDGQRSIYFLTRDIPELIEDDFDDFSIEGLRLRRIKPLEQYLLEFDDGAGTAFSIDCHYLTPPWDYRENVEPTPWYVADNRYHRGWQGQGRLCIAGEEHVIKVTGDSDHSWGRRDTDAFSQRCFKMWSTQVPDGKVVSVIALGPNGSETPFGFIQHGGNTHPVVSFEEQSIYDNRGTQLATEITFLDTSGEATHCRAEAYANFPLGGPGEFWGNEGPARYLVDGKWEANGIISYFWPPEIRQANPPR